MNDEQTYAVVGGRGSMTVFEIYIKTTPERLWEAITSEEMRARYSFGVGTVSDWTPGLGVQGRGPGRDRDRQRREPRGRPAAAPGAELQRALERGRAAGRDLAGDLGDRAGRHLLPPAGDPRPARRRAPTTNSTAAGR